MVYSHRYLLAFLTVLAAPFHLLAQSPPIASAVTNAESKTTKDFSGEPAVIEYIRESMRYENDGSGVRELRSRIRVQTDAGLSQAGQLVFQYNALDEEMDVRSVRVLKKDGSVISVGPEAVQDLTAPLTSQAPIYTDARQKHITVPGLSVGDAVEYDVAVNAKPLVPGHFWRSWAFTTGVISLDEQLDLNVPKDRAVKVGSPEGLEPSVLVEGDRRVYHWATSHLTTHPVDVKNLRLDPTTFLYRPKAPPPSVMFSTFQNWGEVAEWYAQLEKERRVPSPEVRAKAEEITRDLHTDEERARALYYWVSQNIRYVSLSFGIGRYEPHAAGAVLANRYGDCKDKNTLLEAMLEVVGLHASAVLVSITQDVDPKVPNPLQFDHVIAFFDEGGKEIWLDSTVGVAPFGYLLPQLRNSEALVVSPSLSTKLRRLPEEFPFTAEWRITVDGKIDAQGVLDGDVELQTRGDQEVLIRLANEHMSQDQLAKTAPTIQWSNKLLYGGPEYTNFKIVNSTDLSTPLKVRFHVKGKPVYMSASLSRVQLSDSIDYAIMQELNRFRLLPSIEAKGDSKASEAQLPIKLRGPRYYSVSLKLACANLSGADIPPVKEVHLTQDFAELQSRDSWEDTTFLGSKSLDLRIQELPASDSAQYVAFVKELTDAFPAPAKPKTTAVSESSSAAPKPEPAPGKYLASPEAQDMYKRGEDESKRKNWANAIEAFTSATKTDPRYADAWRELGRAHMYAHQYSDAESALRKYLELAPNDHLSYLNMAWVLYSEKKYEEDRDLMLKRIAASPDDGDALYRVGLAYLALHEPAKAVPMLERSIVQFPRYLAAHLNLARAYLENHQDLPAQATLRSAVAIDSSDGTLNSAAYLLSEHKIFLDIADEWSQRSIDVVEKELNDSSLANLKSSTWVFVGKISHYWDTLGWIRFQQGKIDSAQKYILAACQIDDEPTIDFHLGRIYEVQDRKGEAVDMYLAAVKSVPPNGNLSEDVKEARSRLGELLGGDKQVDERLKQFHKNSALPRTVNIPNSDGSQGIAQYATIIDASSKVVELSSPTSEDPLPSLNDAVRAASMPQSFPDTTLKKLPRLSTLACVAGQSCVFTLLPLNAAARITPEN